jgi:hypothetical protein
LHVGLALRGLLALKVYNLKKIKQVNYLSAREVTSLNVIGDFNLENRSRSKVKVIAFPSKLARLHDKECIEKLKLI